MSDGFEPEWSQKSNKSAPQQEEIEKLKKEVYLDGLQVEEEGLTDMLRKKIKQANHDDSLKSHNRNDNEKNLNEALIVSSEIISNFSLLLPSLLSSAWEDPQKRVSIHSRTSQILIYVQISAYYVCV